MQRRPVLAIDIGGTKTLSALVDGDRVVAQRRVETAREGGPQAWLDAVAASIADWSGRYAAAGIAVTGRIAGGRWSALNPAILPVPDGYPLVEVLTERLKVPVTAVNDAQAAAWGEYRFGAGQGTDMVFLTVSTGVGGGLVLGGRLLTGRSGLAGHVGRILTDLSAGEQRLEDIAAGSALARSAAGSGRWSGPPALLAAARGGDPEAEALVDGAVRPLVRAARTLQMLIDPDCFVIGGGLGLAEGFLDRLRRQAAGLPPHYRPEFRAAALGAEAGLIGVADLVDL
ncbi:ROK family protein [Labrys sp. LIt4]|uniref:ROK family protein n=1 Tax=Labrys sp. LIt4 TaxID=2821355 RepID=UPI001FD7259C|nr:ROK family protein [Labrys sp. LIt4]